jgi:hypothetical protein
MIFQDSLGIAHHIREPLLKAGIPAFAAPPPPCAGAFRALVDDVIELRRRRMAAKVRAVPVNTRDPKADQEAERISRTDHLPAIRQRPGRPGAKTSTAPKPLSKSFAAMADELAALAAEAQRQTERIQRETAIALLDDLASAARAGRLDSLSAAKADALQHRHARALGLETTGVRA